MSKHLISYRIAGLCGIAGPLAALILTYSALSASSWFSWTGNTLGDLGFHNAGLLFNSGLILAGILDFPFALGIRQTFKPSNSINLGTAIIIFGGVSLILVGILTEANPAIRLAVAITYLVAFPVGLLLLGLIMRRSSARRVGLFTSLAGIAAGILLFAAQLLFHSWAFSEMLEVFVVAGWSVTLGVGLVFRKADADQGALPLVSAV